MRVLIEVLDDEDEIELAKSVFKEQGWGVRAPRSSEVRVVRPKGRSWLLLEVRLPGFPGSAAKAATRRVDHAIKRFRLAAWVRRAQIVVIPRERDNDYYLTEAPPRWLARRPRLAQAARRIGIPSTTGILRLNASIPAAEVRPKLALLNLGQPLDVSQVSVRAAVPGVSRDGTPVAAEQPSRQSVALTVTAALIAAVCGVWAGWARGPWIAAPLLAGAAMLWPALAARQNQSVRQRLPLVTIVIAMMLVGGDTLGRNTHGSPRLLVIFIAGFGLAAFIARGLVLAVRDSWLARQVAWVIPFALSVLAPFALWLGGTYDAEYLGWFGIPSGAVTAPTIYRLAIATFSAFLGLGFVLFFVALIGWYRYMNWSDYTRWLPLMSLAALSAIYILTAITIGLGTVDGAAADSASAARAGRQPAGYFGIQGGLVCVRPVTAMIPVYDGPLPSRRPLLSFGTTSDQLWLWDPVSGRSIGVPLADVIVVRATGTPARCG